jgi:hypothetical protein
VLDTRVLSLGVFSIIHKFPNSAQPLLPLSRPLPFFLSYERPQDSPDQHRVDIIISRLVPLDAHTRPDVRKQTKRPPQRQVQRDVSLSDRSRQGTFERDGVLLDGSDGVGGDGGLAVDQGRGDVDLFPLDRSFGGAEDGFDGFGDLGADTVTGDQGDGVVALRVHPRRVMSCVS